MSNNYFLWNHDFYFSYHFEKKMFSKKRGDDILEINTSSFKRVWFLINEIQFYRITNYSAWILKQPFQYYIWNLFSKKAHIYIFHINVRYFTLLWIENINDYSLVLRTKKNTNKKLIWNVKEISKYCVSLYRMK